MASGRKIVPKARSRRGAKASCAAKATELLLSRHTVSGEPFVHQQRRDGFTPERRDAFFAYLGDSCNITASARDVGVSTTTVHNWRRKDPEFEQRYQTVIADAYANLEMRLLAIVQEGVTGEQWEEVGTDGVKRIRFRRDVPGQMRLLLLHRQAAQRVADPMPELAPAAARSPRETLDEVIDRLRERVSELEAVEASKNGAQR